MEKFYETLIKEVQENIQQEKYQEALQQLEAEFAMPYIPKEFEDQMIVMYNTCKAHIQEEKGLRKHSEEDIESLLFGGIDEACQAVDLLKGSNIRKHLEVIETYLKSNPHYLIRSLLIEALVEQDIKEEIQLDFDGLDVNFTPTYVELPQQQENVVKAFTMINEFYENDNPSFLMMCVESMLKEMYFRMPFPLGEDEINSFVYAVLEYVYIANGDRESFIQFIGEKNLANDSGFELLLYRYEI